jgi:hypothetical protein
MRILNLAPLISIASCSKWTTLLPGSTAKSGRDGSEKRASPALSQTEQQAGLDHRIQPHSVRTDVEPSDSKEPLADPRIGNNRTEQEPPEIEPGREATSTDDLNPK